MEYDEEENTNAVEQTILESNIVLPKVPKLASSDGQVRPDLLSQRVVVGPG